MCQISQARRRGDSPREVWGSLGGDEPRTTGDVTWRVAEYDQRELYHGGQLIPHRSEERDCKAKTGRIV
ncbi:MAG: hypothetical protein U0903_02675 [Planctomycetales bacterium]